MTTITIRTHLARGISASQGGGQIRTAYNWTAGPLNLLRAARKLPEHQSTMARAYGNIGCGASWLQIDDTRIDAVDLPETLADARLLLDRVTSGAYAADRAAVDDMTRREHAAREAGRAGQPLPSGADDYETAAYREGRDDAARDAADAAAAAAAWAAEENRQRDAEAAADAAARAEWDAQQAREAAAHAAWRAETDARQAAKREARAARRA